MDVRRKVLLDLFASPSTLIPIVGGASTLILSWALGGGAAWNIVGMAGILAGLGWFGTRIILGLEKITADAYEYLRSQQIRKQQENLDQLDRKLRKDRDPRTQESLCELRTVYVRFVEDVKSGKISSAAGDVVEIVDEMFVNAVAQLERSYQLWRDAKETNGGAQKRMLTERDEVVNEVLETVRHLENTIQQFRSVGAKRKGKQLGRLREELDEALRVARRTEERIASWDQEPHVRNQPE